MVKLFRRIVTVVGASAIIAAVLRIRGSGGVPPQTGGWREVDPGSSD